MTTIMRYEISIDAYAITDDANASNDAIIDAFITLANDANATFTNVAIVANDDHAFGPDEIVVAFDATRDDVTRYANAYDCDDDAIRVAS